MSKIDSATIEQYQELLQKDPKSKVFAALADGYRELKLFEAAEQILKKGLTHHPKMPAAYVVWARIFKDLNKLEKSLEMLDKATMLAPDHLLAHQLIGEISLQQKDIKRGLKAYKMVLFLNPQNEKARQVVAKLESVSAEDFDAETFQMRPLRESLLIDGSVAPIERTLSLVDALIVRQEMPRAHQMIISALRQYPAHPELEKRLRMIEPDEAPEEASHIRPQSPREKVAILNKIDRLEAVLKTIEKIRHKEISL